MIDASELFPVGKIIKPHGVKGELACQLTSQAFDMEQCTYFVLDMESILVPFFIESVRYKSDASILLHVDGITSEPQARELRGKTLFLPKKVMNNHAEASELSYDYFIGFTICDAQAGDVGMIDDIDNRTANVLFLVEEKLIPIGDEYITEIDHTNKILYTDLPEGLLDL